MSKEKRLIGLVFDVDDTLYEQIVPFENAYKSLFDMDIDMEQFYLLSRHYSDVKFEASRNGEMTMDEYHIYRIQEAARDLGVLLTDEQALNMQKEYKKNQQKLQMSNITISILELVKENNVKLGIITNGPSEHQWSKIKALAVSRFLCKHNLMFLIKLTIYNFISTYGFYSLEFNKIFREILSRIHRRLALVLDKIIEKSKL